MNAVRLRSLDVLRGLAILGMIFSGMLAKTLPSWLDHGYQPHYRPDAAGVWRSTLIDGSPPFDPRWKAFTWVDLVFPMFLFAMGAAIPLAMSRRLDRGQTKPRAILGVVGRAMTLALFAVIVTQMTTWQLSWPGSTPDASRGRAMIALVGVFLFFVRWPTTTAKSVVVASRVGGLAIVVTLIVLGTRNRAPFTWGESDTIILVLAHCYAVAAIVWVLTRRWGWLRLVAIAPALLLAHYLQFRAPEFADWRWLGDGPLTWPIVSWPAKALDLVWWLPDRAAAWSPQMRSLVNLSPLWNITWYKFLWCVVPGTIVGDALLARRPTTDDRLPRRAVLALSITIVVAVCVGLRHYGFPLLDVGGPFATPWLSLTLALPLLAAMTSLVLSRSADPTARRLMLIGATALTIGLALACLPNASAREGFFEGGVSKGSPATLSYYATSVGLCVLLLLGLLVTADHRPGAATPSVVEANGQNPLLAYFLAHSTIGAIFTFSLFASMNRVIAGSIWLDTTWAVARTILIAAIVWLLTRRRIFWRA